ncbi:alpha/beta hydrolase [Microbacterium sp. NPDC076768]|uniref:alpha/beta hydrolase n=1 Tax=Microbacterium sp. NPDC076768 TaxID=3154858 RepID=UPI0034134646
MQKKPGRRIWKRVLWGVAIVLALLIGGFIAWTQIGVMQADPEQLASVRENSAITVTDAEEGIVLSPAGGESDTGLVFIPGAKVDPWAYAAILQGLAEDGTTVVITRPWLNLAFFDPRGLDAFTSAASDVSVWGVGGHSLGGVRACQLSADADALVLFASYCANDLSSSGLPVLSLAGSEDGLSTPEKVADARDQLPADAQMVEIEGAAHASFGDYGVQSGDGTPTISTEEMHAEVTQLTTDFFAPLAP